MNMKQIFLTAMMLGSTLAFGAANDTILTFSTQGPDTYGDGTTVLDGERYALVWQRTGTSFAGLTADCSPVDPKNTRLVVVAPLAKDGCCPATVFEIDADYAETLKGGSFALYLLDTRVEKNELAKAEKLSVNAIGRVFRGSRVSSDDSDGRGSRASSDDSDGRDSRVASDDSDGRDSRGVSDDSGSKDSIAAVGGVASMKASAVSLAEVGVYTEVAAPKIATIKVTGEKIELKVDGMVDNHDYFVVSGSSPGDFMPALATKPNGDTFTFDVPKGAPFFKVIGARKFR